MNGRTPNMDERKHMAKKREDGCIVCALYLDTYSPPAIHHIDGKTKPHAHYWTIGLCGPHHQTGGEGVALHHNMYRFELNFGTEKELLRAQNERIGYFGEYSV